MNEEIFFGPQFCSNQNSLVCTFVITCGGMHPHSRVWDSTHSIQSLRRISISSLSISFASPSLIFTLVALTKFHPSRIHYHTYICTNGIEHKIRKYNAKHLHQNTSSCALHVLMSAGLPGRKERGTCNTILLLP